MPNTHTPLVSFVVINFNYGAFIEDSIRSILNQDYDNFECIVIDNNSTDNSRYVLNQFHGVDERLKFLYLNQNLNQIGAQLHILDELRGEYLTIVDSDDLVFSNYASTHVKAHLAIPRDIAFTSSCVLETDDKGRPLTPGYSPFLSSTAGDTLRSFATGWTASAAVDIPDFEQAGIKVIPREAQGWHWSPGTANMHKLSLVRATRPCSDRAAYVGATDNYFMWLNHAIAGSATISRPLSVYRNHGRNRFGALPSIQGLQHATPSGANRSAIRRRDITRALLSRSAHFRKLAPDGFWRLMDVPATVNYSTVKIYYSQPQVLKLFAHHLPNLIEVCGEAEVRRELTTRIGATAYKRLRAQAINISKMHGNETANVDADQ